MGDWLRSISEGPWLGGQARGRSEVSWGESGKDPKDLVMLRSVQLGEHVSWCLGILPPDQRAGPGRGAA